jgi:hypothetical protein
MVRLWWALVLLALYLELGGSAQMPDLVICTRSMPPTFARDLQF